MKYLGRIGAVSVVLLLSTYYAVSYYLHYGELTIFEFSGDIIYLTLAWWGGMHFDKARILTKDLQRNQQELESILKYSVDAIVIRDLEGNILEVNPAFEKMTEFTKEEVIGRFVPFIKGKEKDIKQLIQDLLKRKEISGLKVVREKKNGEQLYINNSFFLVRDIYGNPERIVGIERDITEEEKDEQALKESEERYRTLIEFNPDTILVHSNGEILFINKAGVELLGASSEKDLLGKSIYDFIDIPYWEAVKERIKKAHETNRASSILEEKLIGLDGRIIYAGVATMPITYMGRQANQVVVRNITEIKRMEEELRKSDEQLRKITNNISDMLVQANEKFEFVYVSPASIKILGYEPDELLRYNSLELVHPDDLEIVKKGIQKITDIYSNIKLEYRYKHRNGHYIWLESIGNAIFDENKDKIYGYIFASRNISDRKADEELIHKQDRFFQGVSKAMNLLLTMSEYEKSICQTLSILGNMIDADRVYIFENQDGGENGPITNLRFEWVEETVEPLLRNPLFKNFSYQKQGFTRWNDELSSGSIINDVVKKCPESERKILEKNEVQSLLVVPIFIHKVYWGFIGFDDCIKARRWSKNERMIISVAASGIGGAIERKQREVDLQNALIEKQTSEQKLKETNEILKRYTSVDGLTGIANRRYFDSELEQEWNKAVKHKHKLSLIMLDIDFFKNYNDNYGHLNGDECLKQVAEAADTIAQKFGSIAARYGGEEFVVLLPIIEREEVLKIAEFIRDAIEALAIPHTASEIKDIVTVSVGVSSCYPVITMKPTDLIQSADKALYDAKKAGRNRVCEFDSVILS